jgi:Flp pilus assembly protein TadG
MKRFTRLGFRRSWRRVLGTSLRPGREEGSALYEFAMVVPLLGTMLVAIIFGGITFFNYAGLANAVAAGARELGEDGGNQGTAQLACEMAKTALVTAAGNLNASQITSGETFVSASDTCSVTTAPLVQGDTGTVTATYPCNLPIPFTNLNLCPMKSGATLNGVTCPTTYCISATTTVIIQ